MFLSFPFRKVATVLVIAISLTLAAVAQAPVNIPPETPTAEIFQAAGQAYQARRLDVAIYMYQEVAKREPQHPRVWNALGHAYLQSRKLKEAEDSFRKQIALNEFDAYAYNNLGLTLWGQKKTTEAAEMFRKQIEINPLDEYANKNLGSLLLEEYQKQSTDKKKLTEAVSVLEVANKISPKDTHGKMLLAMAYSSAGEKAKSEALFAEARAEMPPVEGSMGFSGGDPLSGLLLSTKPADIAVAEAAEETERIQQELKDKTAAEANPEDEEASNRQAALWALVGDAYFRSGDLAKAESYLLASWKWTQSTTVSDRLGRLYEKQGAKPKAILYYKRALSYFSGPSNSRDRLEALVGKAQAKGMIDRSGGELSTLRTVKLVGPSVLRKKGSGEYVLKLRMTGGTVTVDGVAYAEGELKGMEKAVAAAKYPLSAPGDSAVSMIRRVMVYCGGGVCSATLMPTLTIGMTMKR